jgi:hypothetical protein
MHFYMNLSSRQTSGPAACASCRRRPACLIWPPGYRGGMTETQREPVPRVDSGELDVALAFNSFARHCVLKKAGGLSDEQLRRTPNNPAQIFVVG